MSTVEWYVAMDEVTAGPAPTELVIRGIEHHKIPPEALVCEVGTRRWSPLSTVDAFHAAVVRSYPPPPPDSDEARHWLAHGFRFAPLGALPSFTYPHDDAPDDVTARAPEVAARRLGLHEREAELDAEWDSDVTEEMEALEVEPEPEPDGAPMPEAIAAPPAVPVDWREPFEPFFLVSDTVTLPAEPAILASLEGLTKRPELARATFQEEEALWNLALCLAYGSDAIATAAARTFFDAVADSGAGERIDWMLRALLSSGFMSSGIARTAGARGVQCLRKSCPPGMAPLLS